MRHNRRQFTLAGLAATLAGPAFAEPRGALIIASGEGEGPPAGTRAAYELAIAAGADFIAADLVCSRDGGLLARPDHELSTSTDIARRPEFADRRRAPGADGGERSGWFSEDFTLAELKTLIPAGAGGRPSKGAAPPAILTVQDLIDIARAGSVRTARVVGVYLGLPRAAWLAGQDPAPRLAALIQTNGYNSPAAAMFVAGDDADALKALARLSRVRRVRRVVGAMLVPADLAAIHAYAQAVGVSGGDAVNPAFVGSAHAAGLAVHVVAPGVVESRRLEPLFAAGVDGVLAGQARAAVRARRDAMRRAGGR